MKILVTGGSGFVGSHVCEYYAKRKHSVVALDNLSREKLMKKKKTGAAYNWEYLSRFSNIKRVRGSILDFDTVKSLARNADAIIHTAGQTAVTSSVLDPITDFRVNATGTFHVLEAARQSKSKPAVVVCSTNKVYGENVNTIGIKELKTRYVFSGKFRNGVPENFGVDLCKHTPYGCSKLTADLYAQDYARLYGLKVGVFRMSCIYGTRQFGVEDQGWVSWFAIAALTGQPITIYGNGKQVRDVLWVDDLIHAYDLFLKSKQRHVVLNIGGGSKFTLSLLELLDLLQTKTGRLKIRFSDWRPSDQKVYISNIQQAKKLIGWQPSVSPETGVGRLVDWAHQNRRLFKH